MGECGYLAGPKGALEPRARMRANGEAMTFLALGCSSCGHTLSPVSAAAVCLFARGGEASCFTIPHAQGEPTRREGAPSPDATWSARVKRRGARVRCRRAWMAQEGVSLVGEARAIPESERCVSEAKGFEGEAQRSPRELCQVTSRAKRDVRTLGLLASFLRSGLVPEHFGWRANQFSGCRTGCSARFRCETAPLRADGSARQTLYSFGATRRDGSVGAGPLSRDASRARALSCAPSAHGSGREYASGNRHRTCLFSSFQSHTRGGFLWVT